MNDSKPICTNPLFSKKRVLKTKYISINVKQCAACWRCLSVCPKDVLEKIHFFTHRHICLKNPENCQGCLACQKICPHHAITSRLISF